MKMRNLEEYRGIKELHLFLFNLQDYASFWYEIEECLNYMAEIEMQSFVIMCGV